MNKRIQANIPIESIKRCYVEGKILIKCPGCGETLERNFQDHYISYPIIGEENICYFYCDSCEEKNRPCEYLIPMKIKSAIITIEYDDTKIKEI